MGRAPCCSKVGLHKGPWTPREDTLLRKYVEKHGEGNWRSLPTKAGLLRCGKSCRLRWMNYLRPNIKRGNIDADEDDLIIKLHALLGNRWSLIAGRLPGRTDNEIKNHWNTHLSKVLKRMGIDPTTHKSLAEFPTFEAADACPIPGDNITQEAVKRPEKIIKRNSISCNISNNGSAGNAVKVHAPKANRVNPFAIFPKQLSNINNVIASQSSLTLPLNDQMEDIPPPLMEFPGLIAEQGGGDIYRSDDPFVIDQNYQLSAENASVVSELSSWTDGQKWSLEDPNYHNMLDKKVYDELLNQLLDDCHDTEAGNLLGDSSAGINYCTINDQQVQVLHDDLGWTEHVLI